MSDQTLDILSKYKKIAVYGMSKNPSKPAYTVPMYMRENGYSVIPINPTTDAIADMKTYRSLSEIEEEVEILNVFRPSAEAVDIVEQAIERKNTIGDLKAVWLQLGIYNDEAKVLAEANGLEYIENACMFVEHRKAQQ